MPLLLTPPTIKPDIASPTADLRRREFLGILAAAGLIAGCSAHPRADDVSDSRRSITDAVGRRVEIPTRPERIVSLHEATSGAALLSVGAPVVGMVKDAELPYRPYEHQDIADTGTFAEPDFEAIAALRPDVIVAYSNKGEIAPEGVLEQLERIAPTVAFGEDVAVADYMQAVADVTGRQAEVDEQRTVYERELVELGEAVPQASELTFVMAGAYEGGVYVFIPDNGTASVAVPQAIGLRTASVASRPSEDGLYVNLSAELLGDLDADVILYDDFGKPITELPLWRTLPAVRAGQAHQMRTSFGASYVNYRRAVRELRDVLRDAMPLRVGGAAS